ncbi:MAG: hypothetical protein U0414_29600 [Polyangiaceae bacterium]
MPRRRTIPALVTAALLAGLSGCSSDDSPTHEPSLLDPPKAGEGVQFAMTTTIPAGTEAEHCTFVRAPADADLWVQRDEVRFTQGSHHVLLYQTPYTEIPTQREDGTPVDTSGVFDCSDGATNGFRITKLIGGSQNAEGDSLLAFPAGVAMRVEAGAVLLLNVHYVNASAQDLKPEVRMNLYTVPQASVVTEGDVLFLYNPLIAVGANASSRARMRCPVHHDITLANVQSHMHKRGVGYGAQVDQAAPFYESATWANVPVQVFEPGLVVHAGSKLDYHCDYENQEARDVFQGPRSTDEMCMLIGSYYPTDRATANCEDDDGNLAAEWVGEGSATCADTLGCIQSAFAADAPLQGITTCMLAADPAVSVESSAALDCILRSADPIHDCAPQIGACAAK